MKFLKKKVTNEPVISKVKNELTPIVDHCDTEEFAQHRTKIRKILEQIPSAKTPQGWKYKGTFSIGGVKYWEVNQKSENPEEKAEKFLQQYNFDFKEDYRHEIRDLLEKEFDNYDETQSSEFLRVLCGFLFCIGNVDDVALIRKVKYELSFDVENMIDVNWTDGTGMQRNSMAKELWHEQLVEEYIAYYKGYFNF